MTKLTLALAAFTILAPTSSQANPIRGAVLSAGQLSAIKHFLRADLAETQRDEHEYQKSFPGNYLRFGAAHLPGTDITLIFLEGGTVCGSGGCSMYILKHTHSSFKDIGDISDPILTPITVLNRKHHGMPDIGVWSRLYASSGPVSYQTVLRFDGQKYRLQTRVSLARDIPRMKGAMLISDKDIRIPVF